MICPSCDKEISKNSAFCPWCGFEIKPTRVKQSSTTPYVRSKPFLSIHLIYWIAVLTILFLIIYYTVYRDDKNIIKKTNNQSTKVLQPSKRTILKTREKTNNYRKADRWGLKPPVYIICTSACKTLREARKRKNLLKRKGYSSGYLWIPDYKSLSGAKFYVIFIGPYYSRSQCIRKLREYQRVNKKAYAVLVSHKKARDEIR